MTSHAPHPVPAASPRRRRCTRSLAAAGALGVAMAAAAQGPHEHKAKIELRQVCIPSIPGGPDACEYVFTVELCSHSREEATGGDPGGGGEGGGLLAGVANVAHVVGSLRTSNGAPVNADVSFQTSPIKVNPDHVDVPDADEFYLLNLQSGYAVGRLKAPVASKEAQYRTEQLAFLTEVLNWNWKDPQGGRGPTLSPELAAKWIDELKNEAVAVGKPETIELLAARIAFLESPNSQRLSEVQLPAWFSWVTELLLPAIAHSSEPVFLSLMSTEPEPPAEPEPQDEPEALFRWWPFFVTRVVDGGAIGTDMAIMTFDQANNQGDPVTTIVVANISADSSVINLFVREAEGALLQTFLLLPGEAAVFTVDGTAVSHVVATIDNTRIEEQPITDFLERLKAIRAECFPESPS